MSDHAVIYTDGGSRGNPGPAAAGFVMTDAAGRQILGRGIYIGEATNNVAEYTAMIRALEAACEHGFNAVRVFTDSELMAHQINGRYKVKSDLLRPLYDEVHGLLMRFSSWQVTHVTRDQNTRADALVNQALDLKKDVESSPPSARRAAAHKEPNPKPAPAKPIRLAVLLSGGGTTLLNLLRCIDEGLLNAEIPLVVSSRSTVAGVQRAKKAGLAVRIIRKKDYPDIDAFSKALVKAIDAATVHLVVQAGWLCLWKLPPRYTNRVMNIHPALLPSFGGRGMWGHHVHEAVLNAGCKVSGCTVHFCTNEYDRGPIIVQRTCPVMEDDTPDTLAVRVFEQECIAYPEAIRLFAAGRLRVADGRVRILTPPAANAGRRS